MDLQYLGVKLSLKMLSLFFTSTLDWGSYIISIAKAAYKKIDTLIPSVKFISSEFIFYFYESTISTCKNIVGDRP